MKGYQYHYRRKNIKLRRVLLILFIGSILYLFIKNAEKVFPFLSLKKERLNVIERIIYKVDIEKDRMKKRILIQKAIKKLNRLIEGEEIPDAKILILLGRVYLRKGLLEYNKDLRYMYLDKAVYYFRKALAISTKNSTAGRIYYELGKAYFYKGEYYYYESLMELQKAKRLGYVNKNMEKLISFIKFRKGNINEISELIQNFKESEEESIENYFYKAYKLKDEKRYEEAFKYFHKIEEYFQENEIESEEQRYILMKTYYALGWLYYNDEKYNEAESYYKKSLEIEPDSPEVYYWLGKVYYAVRRLRDAREMWKQALKLKPDYKEALYKLKQLRRRR